MELNKEETNRTTTEKKITVRNNKSSFFFFKKFNCTLFFSKALPVVLEQLLKLFIVINLMLRKLGMDFFHIAKLNLVILFWHDNAEHPYQVIARSAVDVALQSDDIPLLMKKVRWVIQMLMRLSFLSLLMTLEWCGPHTHKKNWKFALNIDRHGEFNSLSRSCAFVNWK